MKYRGQRWRIVKEFKNSVLAVNEESRKLELRMFPKLTLIK